jgi:hypothetical protein
MSIPIVANNVVSIHPRSLASGSVIQMTHGQVVCKERQETIASMIEEKQEKMTGRISALVRNANSLLTNNLLRQMEPHIPD